MVKLRDPAIIAESFNNYFVTIGPTLASKIPPTTSTVFKYLKEPNSNSIFLTPTYELEIQTIIKNLKNTKATGSLIVPVEIIKRCATNTSLPLVHLINKSFL